MEMAFKTLQKTSIMTEFGMHSIAAALMDQRVHKGRLEQPVRLELKAQQEQRVLQAQQGRMD